MLSEQTKKSIVNPEKRQQKRTPSILFTWNKDIRHPDAGGGTQELFLMERWLVARGFSVTQVSGNFPGGKKYDEIDGVKIIRMGNLYSMPFFLWKAQLTHHFLERFDVVVEGLGYVSLLLPLLTRKPLIIICQHLPKEVFFIESPLILGKPLGYAVATLARFIESVVTPRLYRSASIFTCSESSRNELIETGFPEENVYMVPYALANYTIRNEMFPADSEVSGNGSRREDRPTLVCIGRLRKYKGVQDLIHAIPMVKQRYPKVSVFIIGKGNYVEELKKLSQSLDLQSNVTFTGFVSVSEKFQIISSSQLLIMPSYKEGFATPVFEAQMCRTVPIVSDAVGVRDLVSQGQSGMIYPRGDFRALANNILFLLSNPVIRESMMNNGLASIRKIDWQKNQEQFLTMLEERVREGLSFET